VTTLTLTVTLEPFGERHQATVHANALDASGAVDATPDPSSWTDGLLSAVVRDNPRAAVIAALEHAAHDIAHELVRTSAPPTGSRLSGPAGEVFAAALRELSAGP
jgi:hypothetical protein